MHIFAITSSLWLAHICATTKVVFLLVSETTALEWSKKRIHLIDVLFFVCAASNTDATFPTPHASIPGGGTVVRSIMTGIGREYDYLAGKPSETLFHLVSKFTGLDPNTDKLLMVGDRLDTDISWGYRNGFPSLLVMSGVTTQQELDKVRETNDEEHTPTYVLPSVQDMLTMFTK